MRVLGSCGVVDLHDGRFEFSEQRAKPTSASEVFLEGGVFSRLLQLGVRGVG